MENGFSIPESIPFSTILKNSDAILSIPSLKNHDCEKLSQRVSQIKIASVGILIIVIKILFEEEHATEPEPVASFQHGKHCSPVSRIVRGFG